MWMLVIASQLDCISATAPFEHYNTLVRIIIVFYRVAAVSRAVIPPLVPRVCVMRRALLLFLLAAMTVASAGQVEGTRIVLGHFQNTMHALFCYLNMRQSLYVYSVLCIS